MREKQFMRDEQCCCEAERSEFLITIFYIDSGSFV